MERWFPGVLNLSFCEYFSFRWPFALLPCFPAFAPEGQYDNERMHFGWVDAEYQSAAGLIKSSWKYHGDAWVWHISIPEGASALVTLPGETDAVRYAAGDYEFRR